METAETAQSLSPPTAQDNVRRLMTFDQFIKALNGGVVNEDLSDMLRKMSEELHNHNMTHGAKKSKGSITLKVDFTLDGGIFEIVAKTTEKHPEVPRPRSVLWATPENYFTLNNPRQIDMFSGPKGV